MLGGSARIIAGVVVFVTLLGEFAGLDTKEFQKSLPAKIVWAVPGRNADLPCDITPALPGDSISMIFWFRGSMIMPLYTLDARKGPLDKASHLTMGDDLGSRSIFLIDNETSQANLRIQGVKMQDQGVFRCRVDFVNSPTRNFQINLTLVVQPSSPKIFDAEGREIKINQPAGPFLEDQEMFLSCQVKGGNPKPSLTWWLNDTLLDGVIDSSRASSTTVNQLVVRRTPRRFKGARLECRATSSENAGYISRRVPLTIFLKPSKVKIVTPNDLLSIRKAHNIRCETSGSYPPAKVTWLLDGKPIRSSVVTEEETESFTGSILSLNVEADDDGKDLTCRADNPRFPGGYGEDVRKIHVAHPPRVSVRIDAPKETNAVIEEGIDVVLYCDTVARPDADSWSWYFDGHLIPYNESAGVMPSGRNLILRDVKQQFAGRYACAATNAEGETYSAPYELKMQYPPRCRKGFESTRIGALPFETLVLKCHVDAVPDDVKFSWTYNTSKGVFAVQGSRVESKGDVSILNFSLESGDVESLACWASNSVGRQTTPCSFHIVPAEAPESPRSCIVRNASHGLEVSCIAGRDGGLHQSFVMEVADLTGAPSPPPGATTLNDQGEIPGPRYRVLGEKPVFMLHDLEPNRNYQVTVYSENARGKSFPPVILPNIHVSRSDSPNMQREEELEEDEIPAQNPPTTNSNLTIIIVSISVSSVVLILAVVIAAGIIACRKQRTQVKRRRPRRKNRTQEECELSEDGFGENFQRRSAQYRSSMYGDCEERISRMIDRPDLIMPPVSILLPNDADFN